jgi:hypothetical protein
MVNSDHWNSYWYPGSGQLISVDASYAVCYPLFAPLVNAFIRTALDTKIQKTPLETAANVDFIGHRRTFLAVPGFAG